MDNLIHIKKFFEDVYKDSSMYYEYLDSKRNIDSVLYSKWYNEMQKRRDIFAKYVSSSKIYGIHKDYFETALSKDLSISMVNSKIKNIEIEEFHVPKFESKPIGNESYHYISNGVYSTTLENIYNVLNNGAFTVGICTEKKTDEFREIVKFYNTLKDKLMRQGYHAGALESNVPGNNRVYILTYDSRIHNKNKK